jgi:hypothetical protein
MPAETKQIEVRFGAPSPPLREQLKGFNVPAKTVKWWQGYADAITLLVLNGILSDGEAGKARARLFKEIKEGVRNVG